MSTWSSTGFSSGCATCFAVAAAFPIAASGAIDLDEEAFEELKDAILFDNPQARDEEGRGLLWVESPRGGQRRPAG